MLRNPHGAIVDKIRGKKIKNLVLYPKLLLSYFATVT